MIKVKIKEGMKMDKEDLLEKLADILDVDSVTEDAVLRDFESWDSLSALSIIAMADSDYGFKLTAADLRGIKTVAELCEYFGKNATK